MKETFNSQSFNLFQELISLDAQQASPEFLGHKIRSWSRDVTGRSYPRLPDGRISRGDLRELCLDRKNDARECLLAICAWGGMRRGHGENFFREFTAIEAAMNALRDSGKSRAEDFAAMQELQRNGVMKGVGIAYFTKFLFFLRPQADAYILDQWTGKSINLLLQKEFIHLSGEGWVTSKNSPAHYEQFCSYIDELKDRLGLESGGDAEQKIFSLGGRKPLPWRRHVKTEYSNFRNRLAQNSLHELGAK